MYYLVVWWTHIQIGRGKTEVGLLPMNIADARRFSIFNARGPAEAHAQQLLVEYPEDTVMILEVDSERIRVYDWVEPRA